MQFEIEKKNKVKQFSLIFHHLKLLSENINIHFNSDGMYAQGMTSCHCSMFELKLSKDWFDDYSCRKEYVIGVKCELLFNSISCLEEGQKITVNYGEGSDKLKLHFEGKDTITKEFEMKLMDIDEQLMTIPDADYDSDIIFDSDKFAKLIGQLSIFGDDITFNCRSNEDDANFQMSSNGISTGKIIFNIKEEDMVEWVAIDEFNLTSEYSLSYLKHICQFAKLNKNIFISISENLPLKIEYSLSDWMDKLSEEEYPGEEADKKMFLVAEKKEEIKLQHPEISDDKLDDMAWAEINMVPKEEAKEEGNMIKFFVAPKIED